MLYQDKREGFLRLSWWVRNSKESDFNYLVCIYTKLEGGVKILIA